MTDYEMRKMARMQAELLVKALKEDEELLDMMFPPRCMGIEEASKFTSIPVGTLYQKIDDIPHEKVGKRLVFTDRGLTRWLRRSGMRPIAIETPLKKVV